MDAQRPKHFDLYNVVVVTGEKIHPFGQTRTKRTQAANVFGNLTSASFDLERMTACTMMHTMTKRTQHNARRPTQKKPLFVFQSEQKNQLDHCKMDTEI